MSFLDQRILGIARRPLVSVIMPVYNAEKYLFQTINSILNQSLTDFEFIIINDASTDRSLEIIQSFSDPRIRLIENETNKGYIYSLNKSLPLAKGDFIARMDADDLSLPDRFLKQHDFLTHEKNVDLVGAAISVEREGLRSGQEEIWNYPVSPGGVKARLLFNTGHAHPVVFFRRYLVDSGLYKYDSDYYPAEDFDLWVKLNSYANTANLADVQLIYRVSASQTSSVAYQKQKQNASRIRASYFHDLTSIAKDHETNSVYDFWYNDLRVDLKSAIFVFRGFENIYLGSKNEYFRNELAAQVNNLVHSSYQIHPELIKEYTHSAFQERLPLSLRDLAKFTLGRIKKLVND